MTTNNHETPSWELQPMMEEYLRSWNCRALVRPR